MARATWEGAVLVTKPLRRKYLWALVNGAKKRGAHSGNVNGCPQGHTGAGVTIHYLVEDGTLPQSF
ncbi:MAG: hypothetical protein HYX92_03865 [Chloroflexi bacterium]|nr:hypothetical protein [Chloroflexota bacterium]